jgi:NhaA family Na+:H+ antiporter
MIRFVKRFIDQEYFGGLVLVFTAILALIVVNSPLQSLYLQFFSLKFGIHVGNYFLSKPLIMWINEGLMTIFFLLVGIEIKRELFEGELNTLNKAILPLIGAIGGMAIPSLIFAFINWHDPIGLRGWAIPSATDIAFALAVLSLFSKRIPMSLKIFLTALAIMDDLGAIIIIAVFYSNELSLLALMLAGICIIALFILNRANVVRFTPYAVIGFVMWVCVLKSGVHATLTGVVLAFAYPLRDHHNPEKALSHHIESILLPWVNYLVLPLFAFANAGIPLSTIQPGVFLKSVPLGTILGLFLGKQIGVFGSCWLAVKMKIANLPANTSWQHLYAVAILCGIGFTMSLFIGGLAYDGLSASYMEMVRLGVLAASLLSAIVGGLFIIFAL